MPSNFSRHIQTQTDKTVNRWTQTDNQQTQSYTSRYRQTTASTNRHQSTHTNASGRHLKIVQRLRKTRCELLLFWLTNCRPVLGVPQRLHAAVHIMLHCMGSSEVFKLLEAATLYRNMYTNPYRVLYMAIVALKQNNRPFNCSQ